jgi:hypothetical protein
LKNDLVVSPEVRQYVDRSALGTALIAAGVLLSLLVPYSLFRSSAGAYTLGAIAGIPSGFLISVALYWMSGPTLRVSIAGSEYDGVSAGYWVHLAVTNSSWNVLGSGTARECVGKVKFPGLRRHAVTWGSRPNPIRDLPITFPGGGTAVLKFADPLLFDQKRTETLRPDDPTPKLLDIAWRPKGVEEAYVSIPEHFQGASITLFSDAKIGVGEFTFSVEFEHANGRSSRWWFVLVNRGGKDMRTGSLFIRRANLAEKRKARLAP